MMSFFLRSFFYNAWVCRFKQELGRSIELGTSKVKTDDIFVHFMQAYKLYQEKSQWSEKEKTEIIKKNMKTYATQCKDAIAS